MAIDNTEESVEARQECFLCTLDPGHSCHKAQLDGRLVAARERVINGQRTPIVTLDTGIERVEIYLEDRYYRELIKALKAREGNYKLTMRVYHLPTLPNKRRYAANTYSLAVLEPDRLLNITDLHQAEYCQRQYLLNRLSPSTTTAATIRGNIVHYCFKELLKEHGHLTTGELAESARQALKRHLEQALQLNGIEMALANVSVSTMRADVAPHLDSLANWFESESATLWDMASADEEGNQVRAETFLLAPEIGLRGRLDLFWQHAGKRHLLELKTGGDNGSLPRSAHRWQVLGYHALLAVRRDSKMKKAEATLLYSGTPGKAQAFGIPATIRELQRVNETRNLLILSRVTNIPAAPPGPARCSKCAMLNQCQGVSSLLGWSAPTIDNRASAQHTDMGPSEITISQPQTANTRLLSIDTSEDRDFFANYYQLLNIEGTAGEQQQALLWQTPVDERIAAGKAISDLHPVDAPIVDKDGWQQAFSCTNTSELREGDEILLSNGDPIAGEVVTGTIIAISSEQVTVWTRELIAHPTLLDRYDNDIVHVRTLQNLLRWFDADLHIRDLVAGKVYPRFIEKPIAPRPGFNTEQNLAVERAMQAQDYLLIHGPPGTGKTSVIAEIVRHLCQTGQRVMLAAFTNQAVDNMLQRLDKEGFHDYLRLGNERSVNEHVRQRLLKNLVATEQDNKDTADLVREVLGSVPVVASTTATLSSDRYTPLEESNLRFDVAIIDEAGQLTVPAILGALRFARRFILVGDEKQLPPLVLSKEAAEKGLANSLFDILKQRDIDYMKKHTMAISACVALKTQYRMNKWISNFSSTVFYEKQLLAHESVANRQLVFSAPQAARSDDAKRSRESGVSDRIRDEATRQEDPAISKAITPNWPLVFLDVQATESEPKMSNAEAQAVRKTVDALLARGIAPQDIGIIAPYRAQVANIRRHLFDSISIDTVDRFQGGERPIIIMSFATTVEPPPESQRREFLVNPNRLNVALTRAQSKLILIGCAAALEHLPTFSRLLTYCRSMNTLIPFSSGA